METKKECLHKNIVITRKSYYEIDNGYLNEAEKNDFDLGKYFLEEDEVSVFCEDCGEYLTD